MPARRAVLRLEPLGDRTAPSVTPVADINRTPSGQALPPVEVNGVVYFAGPAEAGPALWKSDGTVAGTVPVAGVLPGQGTAFREQMYFLGRHPEQGYGLWRSDGTPGGTALVKSLTEPDFPDRVTSLAVVGDRLYFTAGRLLDELWKTDGTAAGTARVRAFQNPNSSYIGENGALTPAGGKLYFGATVGLNDGIWVTDGTPAGTRQVKANSGFPVAHNGAVYFAAEEPDGGAALWRTDGTPAGTRRETGLPVYRSSVFVPMNGALYFAGSHEPFNRELWRTDGTPAGTYMVKEIYPGSQSSLYPGSPMVADGSVLYFVADGPAGAEVWRTDGTETGTEMVIDLFPGPGSSLAANLVRTAGGLYFTATDGVTGQALWRTDGTAGGTVRIADLDPGPGLSYPHHVLAAGPNLFGFANTAAQGAVLWATDGAGPAAVLAPTRTYTEGSNVGYTPDGAAAAIAFDGRVFFAATSGLWATDGTTAGTGLVQTFQFRPEHFAVSGGLLYFSGDAELWVTDGTPAGTRLVKDIAPGPTFGSFPGYLTPFNGRVYFSAFVPGQGTELWVSDGTQAGTTLVKDVSLETSPQNAFDPHFYEFNGSLYFVAAAPTPGQFEIWRTDGTPDGTAPVAGAPRFGFFAWRPQPVGNDLVYMAGTGPDGPKLYATDGTTGATRLVKDVGGMDPVLLNGVVYFLRDRSLWRTDGTADGTVPVASLPSALSDLRVINGRLIFTGNSEVYTSDGTAAGTRLLLDFPLGRPGIFWEAGGHLYFFDPDVNGRCWRTDGTPEGTQVVRVHSAWRSLGESPDGAPLVGYDDGLIGGELWRYDPLTARADVYVLEDDLVLRVPAAAGVLANDTDGPAGTCRPAAAERIAGPEHGWLTFRPDGSFDYQPFSRDFSGTDAFTYRATGIGDASGPTTVTIAVDLVNQAPAPADDAATGRAGRAVAVKVLANDRDPDHDSLVIESFTQGANGAVRKVGTSLVYSPKVGGALTDTFTYTVRDPRGATATATVSVTLTPTAVPKVTAVRVFPGAGPGSIDLARTARRVLPFGRLARVEVTFSADVAVAADDLRLIGVAGGTYALTGFAYDPARRTATWEVQGPAEDWNDRVTFLLDGSGATGVTAAGGGAGVGDWTKSVGVLTGDVTGDGLVTAADVAAARRRVGRPAAANPFADIDGNGLIEATDLDRVSARVGERLL